MRTPGEIDAAVCAGVSRFKQEYMARGPKDLRAQLLLARTPEVRSPIEQ